jgi:hypothetical protein
MEQYLSKNRMNPGLQKLTEAVFNGLTRLQAGLTVAILQQCDN